MIDLQIRLRRILDPKLYDRLLSLFVLTLSIGSDG
jgi:hypothetical protein